MPRRSTASRPHREVDHERRVFVLFMTFLFLFFGDKFGQHRGRQPAPDHVHERTCFAHDAVDAQNQCHAGDRNGGHNRQRRDQRNEARSGHAARAL